MPLTHTRAQPLPDYDGSPPNFNLFNEGSPDGLTLSYYGALPYINDPFPCSASTVVDPSTGIAPTRTVTIALLCDRTVASGLQNIRYREVSACNCECARVLGPPSLRAR